MSSLITTSSIRINASYPVAGQDNDSQGFRDNFSAIRSGLNQAASEITDLQTYSVRTTTATNFNGNLVTGATLVGNTQVADAYYGYPSGGDVWGTNNNLINGASNNSTIISFGAADYIITKISTSTTYTITGWPAKGALGKVRFEVQGDGTSIVNSATCSLQFLTDLATTSTTYWINDIDNGADRYTTVYYSSTKQIWDLWSVDNGKSLWIQLVGTSRL